MFKYCFLIFLFFQTTITFGQELNGFIKDTSRKPISNASVVIYQNKNIIGYSYSKDNGSYQIVIKTPKKDSLQIVVNALGFKSKKKTFY